MTVKARDLRVRKMEFHPEKCTGCLLCLMFCSLRYEGAVNPLKARSQIIRNGNITEKITLTKDCTFCGHCVTVCPYGARTLGR